MRDFVHESGLFACETRGEIALLRLHGSVLGFAEDPQATEDFFTCLSRAEGQRDTKALVIIHSGGSLCESHYRDYVNQVSDRNDHQEVWPNLKMDILRAEHALRRFILSVTNFSKILVACFQGQVASPYFGALLAADIRIACENTQVRMSHMDHGIPPDGGLAFFLPQFLGRGKAIELLLLGDALGAKELLGLGLVSAVVAEDNFGEDCLLIVERFLGTPASSVRFTKQVLNLPTSVVRRHLEGEYLTLKRALNQP